jgi:hypothetical protein
VLVIGGDDQYAEFLHLVIAKPGSVLYAVLTAAPIVSLGQAPVRLISPAARSAA